MQTKPVHSQCHGIPLIINSINLSIDNSLLTLATNKGYQIFSFSTHKQLSSFSKVGSLSFANTFFKSQLIFLIGTETNKILPPSHFLIWDDCKRVKKGGLKLKSPITNAFISQRIIFLFTKETLLLFDMISLSFIKSISNLYYHKNAITYSINSNNTIAYVSNEAINTVRIRQIEIEENKKISVRKDDIETNFSFIQALKMSSNFKYIAVFTFNGNKMHIYDIQTKFLSMCFYLGNEISTIRQINFDIKEKFILIIHEIEEQGKLTLIKLNAEKKKCSCKEHDDNDLLEKTNDKEEKNFISLWFDGVKDRFCSSDKGDEVYDEINVKNAQDVLYGDFMLNYKNQIELILSNGAYLKYIFDRKKSHSIKYIKEKW